MPNAACIPMRTNLWEVRAALLHPRCPCGCGQNGSLIFAEVSPCGRALHCHRGRHSPAAQTVLASLNENSRRVVDEAQFHDDHRLQTCQTPTCN